jgi:hypothetical protein
VLMRDRDKKCLGQTKNKNLDATVPCPPQQMMLGKHRRSRYFQYQAARSSFMLPGLQNLVVRVGTVELLCKKSMGFTMMRPYLPRSYCEFQIYTTIVARKKKR